MGENFFGKKNIQMAPVILLWGRDGYMEGFMHIPLVYFPNYLTLIFFTITINGLTWNLRSSNSIQHLENINCHLPFAVGQTAPCPHMKAETTGYTDWIRPAAFHCGSITTSIGTLGKLANVSVPLFPHRWNEYKMLPTSQGLLWRINGPTCKALVLGTY